MRRQCGLTRISEISGSSLRDGGNMVAVSDEAIQQTTRVAASLAMTKGARVPFPSFSILHFQFSIPQRGLEPAAFLW
ncbi:MAG: hypothetical protein LBT00_09375 [Spirochaetaceae bacterium]|nr:hypothetical protein [Spirochaetaceae bacterium]